MLELARAIRNSLGLLLLACVVAVSTPAALDAQSRFSPELQVGDTVITRYQIDQRALFLSVLGAPGDARALAREQLTNEAVQMAAAREDGIIPDEAAINAGIVEFTSRGNLTPDQFEALLAQAGISPGTFRDFITAGVAWRDTIRARFGEELRGSITPLQIRRAIASTGTEGGLRVLVSEILLPANSPETRRASQSRAAEISALSGETAFSTAARQFSVAPSSARGGELNWVALESLPDGVRSAIAAMTPGQITRPIDLENAIGIFLLRDVERVKAGTPSTLSIDYALFIVGGDRAAANGIAARIDTCDDLYGVAHGLPEDRLIRETTPIAELPADIRSAIGSMDEGETTTALTRSGQPTVLMLCERTAATESTVDADIIGNRLLNTRLGTAASHYFATLRADTVIIDLTN